MTEFVGWFGFCVGLATAAGAGVMLVKCAGEFIHHASAGRSGVTAAALELVLFAACSAIAWVGLLIMATR